MSWCADATVKEMPSHRSQCGGFAVSQNSNAQSSHAHTRCRFLLFILLTINDSSNGPALGRLVKTICVCACVFATPGVGELGIG